ncbi:MAG: hypothetical protein JSV30_03090 [Candidatus Omnitrophota bacterium]|nr:MAG: hypothetical protein JSV30_03090 [Candidatus Omnitrophota bacterium]
MRKLLLLFFAVPILSGCGALRESIMDVYQEERAVEKGAYVMDEEGLYAFTITADDYYMERTANGVALIPRNFIAAEQGNYLLQTCPIEKVPENIRGDLKKSLDWINEKVIFKKAKQKADILLIEKRKFKDKNALYIEYFIPGKVKNGAGDRPAIERMSYGYSSVIFYHKDHLYWIYHSDPYDPLDESLQANPVVKENTQEAFEAFLEQVSIDF